MDERTFSTIPDYPGNISAGTSICRLLDGLGFRFFWATEGLNEYAHDFRLSEESMSIGELTRHIWGLLNWMCVGICGIKSQLPETVKAQKEHSLELIYQLRNTFCGMDDTELTTLRLEGKPFWNMINGPIADILTHVGQINMLRRAAGFPPLRCNPFDGTPPKDTNGQRGNS